MIATHDAPTVADEIQCQAEALATRIIGIYGEFGLAPVERRLYTRDSNHVCAAGALGVHACGGLNQLRAMDRDIYDILSNLSPVLITGIMNAFDGAATCKHMGGVYEIGWRAGRLVREHFFGAAGHASHS